MTLSPKTFTSIAPLARSTRRVSISRIALERAFTSIAHIPRIIGVLIPSVAADKSEWEPLGDGVGDLVSLDTERGDVERDSEGLNIDIRERERVECPLVDIELVLALSRLWLV